MAFDPAEMVHLVDIEEPVTVQDSSGELTETWQPIASDATSLFAKIAPVSVREFIASQQMQGEITTRIVIGFRDDLTPNMRIVGRSRPYTGHIFNVHGWLNDPETGVDYITAPCSEGVNAG